MTKDNKVLIITYYWPPSGGAGVQRWVKFTKYLPLFNITPIVLTVSNGTYPLIDESLTDQIHKDLKVFTSKAIEPYALYASITGKSKTEVATPADVFSAKKTFLQKLGVWVRANFFIPDARRGWVRPTIKQASSLIKNYGINTVITTGPPNSSHLIGRALKKSYPRLRWIMDMRDPWSKIFFNQHIPRTRLAQYLDERLEKNCLEESDEVVVVSESMKAVQSGIYNRKYHVISNGFDHEDFGTVPRVNNTDNRFSIKYIGSMTEAAIPYNLFKAISQLPKNLKAQLQLDFFGSINPKVFKVIDNQGISDIVSQHSYLPHLAAKKEMQSADVLLLVIPDTKDNELIITGKIFDYLGAQKPILCIGPKPGDACELIESYSLGKCFDHTEMNDLFGWLSEVITNRKVAYKPWDNDLKNHPFSRFSLTEEYARLIID